MTNVAWTFYFLSLIFISLIGAANGFNICIFPITVGVIGLIHTAVKSF